MRLEFIEVGEQSGVHALGLLVLNPVARVESHQSAVIAQGDALAG